MQATSSTFARKSDMIPRVVISQKLLNEGEHVVLSTRTHAKALFLPAVVLIVIAGAGRLPLQPSRRRRTPRTWRWSSG